MINPFRRRQKQTEQEPSLMVEEDSITQILVRLGKLSPFTLGALLVTLTQVSDDEVAQQLVNRRLVSQQDIEIARQVQAKLRAGQPIYEEWAKMEMLMAENKRCAQELTEAIAEKKDRRRKRGEDTTMFLTPRHLRSAT